MGVRDDATSVLIALASYEKSPADPERGRHMVGGPALSQATGIPAERLNDAAELLDGSGYSQVIRAFGAAPYDFIGIQLTARGRAEAERLTIEPSQTQREPSERKSRTGSPARGGNESKATPSGVNINLKTSPTPVGSPYGFTDQDWAAVAVDHADRERLIVSFGFAWNCEYYNSADLEKNVRSGVSSALDRVNERHRAKVRLEFRKLQGGYGAHLFNNIARDVISSDIAIFDSSAHNPNVMIELGVALTWGTTALPIRYRGAPPPPSDISGHTWAEYDDSAATWTDPNHDEKLFHLIQVTLRRKGAIA